MRQLQQAHHCKALKIQPHFGTCVVHVTSEDRQFGQMLTFGGGINHYLWKKARNHFI